MFTIAKIEILIARRNMWVTVSVVLMALFSVVLTLTGGAPTGTLGVDPLIIATSSITTLSVYFIPLVALLLAFDAISGEIERGTLALSLTYPLSRAQILLGKFIAHFLVLAFAIGVGLLLSGTLAVIKNGGATGLSFTPLLWLFFTSLMLGATFLGLGYLISALVRQPSAASGLAIVVWLVFVVLYDIILLGALVGDKGGFFSDNIFPFLLVANPSDAFRLLNMPEMGSKELTSGISAAGDISGRLGQLISLFLWPILALFLAWLKLKRIES